MLENKTLGLFFLFFLFASFLILSKSLQKQNPKTPDVKPKNILETSQLPSQAVVNFYSTYLSFKGDLLSESAFSGSQYLTDDFKNKLKAEVLKKPFINPLICAGDKPEQVIFHQATISGSLAIVLVTQTFQNQSRDHLVKLKHIGKDYKIYDIMCN